MKKFSHKCWVKIHPVNTNYAENTDIKYNRLSIHGKLVLYHDGYILSKAMIANTHVDVGALELGDRANVAP